MAERVLVVEDEPEMQVMLRDNLEYEGFEVVVVTTGEDVLPAVTRERPDVILLDLMLPKMSGYEVCRQLRAKHTSAAIIMLTARNADIDRVAGLELGADDYVGKPFGIRELIARIRAQIRRRTPAWPATHAVSLGDLEVDLAAREVRRAGRLLNLSAREFDLLAYLIAHRGEVVTREQLLTDVWSYQNVPTTRTIDNFIVKLRKKIEKDPQEPHHVITVHGAGYRFIL